MSSHSPRPPRHRTPWLSSQKDRLGAVVLALIVLIYCLLSIYRPVDPAPPATIPIQLLASDSVGNGAGMADPQGQAAYRSPSRRGYPQRSAWAYRSTKAWNEPGQPPVARQRTTSLLPLNQCDSAALEALPGIGPVLASRIVRYREKLGGFCKTEQLKEVYGIDDTLYRFIADRFVRGALPVKKIGINSASLDVLRQHPYLGWQTARSLVRYREAHGPFQELQALYRVWPLDSASIQRLAPYLLFDMPHNNPGDTATTGPPA